MEIKACSMCRETKTVDRFHKATRKKSGLCSRCKICRSAVAKSKYSPEKAHARYQKARSDPRVRSKDICRSKKWRDSHPQKHRDNAENWRKNNLSRVCERVKKWQRNNPEKVKARNMINRVARQFKKTNRLLNGEKYPSASQISLIIDAFKKTCAYCGNLYKHLDHINPLSRGGSVEIGNIVPACLRCNGRKSAKTISEWYFHQPFYNAEKRDLIEAAMLM